MRQNCQKTRVGAAEVIFGLGSFARLKLVQRMCDLPSMCVELCERCDLSDDNALGGAE